MGCERVDSGFLQEPHNGIESPMADERGAMRQSLLTDLESLLDRSEIAGLCSNCGMGMMSEAHTCDPERASHGMIVQAWRHYLGASPQKRAKGYAVQ